LTLDKKAAKEAISDVAIGVAMAFPISFALLSLTKYLEFSVAMTSIVQTLVFTFVALVRKYFVRVFYKKRENNESI
jgi:uncharacterized membrane protein